MKHFKMLAVLLAVLTFATSSFAGDGGGKHGTTKGSATKQTTAVKKSKAFDPVTYKYVSGPTNLASSYSTNAVTCDGSGSTLCSISFDGSFTLDQAVAVLPSSGPFTNGHVYGTSPSVTVHTQS